MEKSDFLQMRQILTERGVLIDETVASCSKCFKIIPARVIESDNRIFLHKNCCNEEIVLLENDAEFYKKLVLPFQFEREVVRIGKDRRDGDIRQTLIEEAPVVILEVTTKCNLKCPICYVDLGPTAPLLQDINPSIGEIRQFLSGFRGRLVCLIGKEPTMRLDLAEIISEVVKSGNTPVLCTNGLRLVNLEYLRTLKKAGLRIVSFSFDGFSEKAYEVFRGRKLLKLKLMILKNLIQEKMSIHLDLVVGKNVNEEEILNVMKFAYLSKGRIAGINFIPLYNPDMKYDEKLTHSDILKLLQSITGIDSEYLYQLRMLKYNVYQLIGKMFGKRMQNRLSNVILGTIYLKWGENSFEPYFEMEKLTKWSNAFSEALSKRSKGAALMHLVANSHEFLSRKLFRFLLASVSSGLNLAESGLKIEKLGILKISIQHILSPFNEDLKRRISVSTDFLLSGRYF